MDRVDQMRFKEQILKAYLEYFKANAKAGQNLDDHKSQLELLAKRARLQGMTDLYQAIATSRYSQDKIRNQLEAWEHEARKHRGQEATL